MLPSLHLLSRFFEHDLPGTERRQVTAPDAEDDRPGVSRIRGDEWVARHIVACRNGQPFVCSERNWAAVLNHRVDERGFHLACVMFLGIVERSGIDLSTL